jgi:hypothetical protein
MIDRITKACEARFERYVEELFEHPKMLSKMCLAEIPIIGGVYLTDGVPEEVRKDVVRALVARERFRQDWPSWPQPLPLNIDLCPELQRDGCPRVRLMAYYGWSLSGTSPNYDYERHPHFDVFASGLMAYEHTPLEIRCDRELQRQFPPRPLAGLCDGQMVWRTDEQIAWARDMLRRAAESDAEFAAARCR